MKTRITSALKASLVAGLVLAVAGCASEPNAPPVIKAAGTNAASPAAATTNAPAPTVLKTNVAEQAEAPVQKVAPKRVALPPGADQVADLAQAGVGESVMLEFVKNSNATYDLNVDEIVYLTDLGIPDSVLAAMLRHGKEMQERTAPTTAVAEAAPPSAPAAEGAPAPAHEALAATTAPEAPAATTEAPPPPSEPVAAPAAATQYEYTQPPTQVTYNYFYETLSPYGSWLELPGYGWCWQPTCAVIDPFWRPYWHRGHWAYTDCGWYWASDYSWGWAPFHYGRWHRHHWYGWLWVPGYVWGPAWVTWRHWDTYCGWAPLPPEAGWDVHLGLTYNGAGVGVGFGFGLGWDSFAFVHYRYLNHPRVWHYPLPRHEVTKGYGRSMVLSNIVPGRGGVIVNGGIAPERVKAVTRREVPKITLRDISPGPASPHKPDRYDRETKQLAVYRPKPPANGLVSPSRPVEPAYQPARRLQEARKDSLGSPAPERRPGASPGVRSLPPAATVVPSGRSTSATRVQAPMRSRLAEEGKLSAPARPSASSPPIRQQSAPAQPASPARPTAPAAGSQPAPSRASQPVTVSPPSSTRLPALPAPTREVSPRAPAYQSPPASQPRYSAPTPAAPTQRPPSSPPAAPPRPKQDSYAPPPAWSRPAPAYTRSEARKTEPVTPNYTAPPKFASAPPMAPSYSPVPAPSQPRFAPAAPSYAPAPSAPPHPSFSPPASSPPSYAAPPPSYAAPPPSQPSRAAPAPSSPPGGGGGGGARGGRNRAN
jgi:hypothetical protein